MTKLLYLQDTYLFETNVVITSMGQDEKGYFVILDQTIFYPQGGGQPFDQGTLKGQNFNVKVIRVHNVEGQIRHYVDIAPEVFLKGQEIICIVDQPRRMLNARYHTAAHLLGNVVESLYPALKAIKGHSFPKEAYVEFQGGDCPDAKSLEGAIKEVIRQNYLTRIFESDPTSFEEKFYKLPYLIPGNKAFRVMQIGNFPPVPCGGTHLASTNEIGGMVIPKIKSKNNIVKISYELL